MRDVEMRTQRKGSQSDCKIADTLPDVCQTWLVGPDDGVLTVTKIWDWKA